MLTCKTYEIEHGLAGGVSCLVGGGGQLHTHRVPIKLLIVGGLWSVDGAWDNVLHKSLLRRWRSRRILKEVNGSTTFTNTLESHAPHPFYVWKSVFTARQPFMAALNSYFRLTLSS